MIWVLGVSFYILITLLLAVGLGAAGIETAAPIAVFWPITLPLALVMLPVFLLFALTEWVADRASSAAAYPAQELKKERREKE